MPYLTYKEIAYNKRTKDLRHEITAQLINTFVFATHIVQPPPVTLYRSVCVRLCQKPLIQVFSRRGSDVIIKKIKLKSFKTSEHINEESDGPYRGL